MAEEEKKKRKKKAEETEGGKEHKTPWQKTYATVEEIKTFLADRIYFRHNVVTRRTECRLPSGWKVEGGVWKESTSDTDQWQPINDRIVNSLWAELSKEKSARAAITMPSIDERAAYAHFHEHRKHIASFCATGNNVQFLYFRQPRDAEPGVFMSVARAIQAAAGEGSVDSSGQYF